MALTILHVNDLEKSLLIDQQWEVGPNSILYKPLGPPRLLSKQS